MSTKTRALTRVLLRDDLRDWSTLIFTFIFPSVLLVVLILTIADRVPGMDLTCLLYTSPSPRDRG